MEASRDPYGQHMAGFAFQSKFPAPMVLVELGRLAHEYWDGGETVSLPAKKVLKKIGERNWTREVPSFSDKYRSVIETVMRRIWKKSS